VYTGRSKSLEIWSQKKRENKNQKKIKGGVRCWVLRKVKKRLKEIGGSVVGFLVTRVGSRNLKEEGVTS